MYPSAISNKSYLSPRGQSESDPAKLAAFYADRSKELAVLKRSAIVNQLYGGWRLVVEDQQPARERGDT